MEPRQPSEDYDTTMSWSAPDETTEMPTAPTPAPAAPGLVAPMGQQCPRCGTQLAADQRYCVECGERRGDPRLPFMDGRTRPDATAVLAPLPPAPPRRPRLSSSTGLIAGVGVLVLALGTGVLIGRSGNQDEPVAQKSPAVQVVTVPGAGGAAPTAASPAADASTAASAKAKKASADAKAKKAAAAVTVDKSAGNVPKAADPVVKVGQKGHGPGYKDGKFTGDFFGG
jgi:hypothetical protein